MPQDQNESRGRRGRPRSISASAGSVQQDIGSVSPPLSVTVKQAANATGLGESTIWAAIKDGRIRSRKFLGRRIITYADLQRAIEAAE
jgi:excisionase family DNA binding protein